MTTRRAFLRSALATFALATGLARTECALASGRGHQDDVGWISADGYLDISSMIGYTCELSVIVRERDGSWKRLSACVGPLKGNEILQWQYDRDTMRARLLVDDDPVGLA